MHSALIFFAVLAGLAMLGICFVAYVFRGMSMLPKCNQCDKNTYHPETATHIYTTCNGRCIKTARD